MSSKSIIKVRVVESFAQELNDVQDRIRVRAYDRFVQRGYQPGDESEDWRVASADLISQPAIALSEVNGRFVVLFAVSGVAAKELELLVTENGALLQSRPEALIDIPGVVHFCEFQPRQIFRSVEFPRPIDPRTIAVEYDGGVYKVTASIAGDAEVEARPKLEAAKAAKPKAKAKAKAASRGGDDLRESSRCEG
jgi:HSP20 family molecular chaperone IbpA